MSAPMPERVLAYVSVFGTYSQIKDEYHDVECILVPESRLREAEAELEALRIAHSDVTSVCDDNAALRADLAALVPLARLGLLAIDANSYFPVRAIEWGLIDWHRRDTANLTAARAILDREGV